MPALQVESSIVAEHVPSTRIPQPKLGQKTNNTTEVMLKFPIPSVIDKTIKKRVCAQAVAAHNQQAQGVVARLVEEEEDAVVELSSNNLATKKDETVQLLTKLMLQAAVSQHLTEGCDDRTMLNAEGKNKYHCKPRPPPENLILRGFSTCSPPTKDSYKHCCNILESIWSGNDTFAENMESLEEHILTQQEFDPSNHSIVFHPSGTDSEFLPLVYALALARSTNKKGVINVVTGAGEVGSKTAKAAGGKFIAPCTPFGVSCVDGETLPGFPSPDVVKVIEVKPRATCGGIDMDYDNMVAAAVRKANEENPDFVFVLHSVLGSKLGAVIPSDDVILKLQQELGQDRVVLALDCCQLRHSPEALRKWVDDYNCIALITGSKFFCGPGFCGGCLIGQQMIENIDRLVPQYCKDLMSSYGLFVTKHDVNKQHLPNLKELLPETNNFGMLMRWSCAKNEMSTFCPTRQTFEEYIPKWVDAVHSMVDQYNPTLSNPVCPVSQFPCTGPSLMGETNTLVPVHPLPDSIDSEPSKELSVDQVKEIYRWMMQDMTHLQPIIDKCGGALPPPTCTLDNHTITLPEWPLVLSRPCLIGQPVNLGSYTIVRIALGAPIAVQMVDTPALTTISSDDALIVWKLATLTKYYHSIVKSLAEDDNANNSA